MKNLTLVLFSSLLLSAALHAAPPSAKPAAKPAPAAAVVYDIDPQHSSVGFSVRHMTVSKVRGRFTQFTGDFVYLKGKPALWKAQAAIDTMSVDTDIEARDKHLRSADFFNCDKFPQMVFKSTKATDLKGEKAKLHGELTLLGVTKPVVLDLEIGGEAKDPWGGERAGFSAHGKINRKDFGMVWNKTLDAGGVMVGEDVELFLEVEGVRRKS
ncbi:MAG: YceI family protein [Elusimicrobiota bacterium]|jgi:polyisoprenoid-binding protein YceI